MAIPNRDFPIAHRCSRSSLIATFPHPILARQSEDKQKRHEQMPVAFSKRAAQTLAVVALLELVDATLRIDEALGARVKRV